MHKITVTIYNSNGDFFMNKRYLIISILLTFAMGFIIHNIYNWVPNVITTIFPVNESLYEHVKLIYLSPILAGIIIYFYLKVKGYHINNFLFGLMVSTVFNIIIFYLVYLPFYRMYGSVMWMTLTIYFITIVLSQYLNYLIVEMNNNRKLNIISFIMLIIGIFILTYFTYHPMKKEFFKDPKNNSYGINK